MTTRIQLRGDTAANWASSNPVLAAREMALEMDTQRFKVGDGTTVWNSLSYWNTQATEQVAAPTFSPLAGTYASAQSVAIASSTVGATIHFTTDGSTPSASSTVYTSPISVPASVTIKAIAVKAGISDSAVASATFTIGAGAYVNWTDSVGAAASGDYLVLAGSLPAGARSVATIDATEPFSVVLDADTPSAVDGIFVYLDSVSGDDFAWDSAKSCVAGFYPYSGNVFGKAGTAAEFDAGALTLPGLIRMQKSGNDIVFGVSTNGGTTWTPLATASGVLAGKTTLYLKGLFAIGGSKQMRVQAG